MQMETNFAYIDENYKRIVDAMEEAKAKYRKPSDDITLMAVTKTVAPEAVNHAISCGIHTLGENRVQEYLSKKDFYSKDAKVHFIGHLQTNKVKYIIEDMDLIHSVDSIKLAREIDRHCAAIGKVMDVLLEVNIGREENKTGVFPELLPALLEEAGKLEHIRVRGLMTIPPVCETEEEVLQYFSQMRQLFIDIKQKKYDNISMEILSMGMSADYLAAVRCGSNIVRIGTAMFGQRNYKRS